jgi:hypothetical protein
MKNIEVQKGPEATRRKKGLWNKWGVASTLSAGDRYSGKNAFRQCPVTMHREAIPRIPCALAIHIGRVYICPLYVS